MFREGLGYLEPRKDAMGKPLRSGLFFNPVSISEGIVKKRCAGDLSLNGA
jgi:hypothetical protein